MDVDNRSTVQSNKNPLSDSNNISSGIELRINPSIHRIDHGYHHQNHDHHEVLKQAAV